MGNGFSKSTASSANDEAEVPRCYYEILGVNQDVAPDEIKRAYRRMALVHHPDKNPGREEEATRIFATVQSAYEVLSDLQERAWYDRNRTALLRPNRSNNSAANNGPTIDDLLPYFRPSAYAGFDPAGKKSFYNVYAHLFLQIDDFEREGRPPSLCAAAPLFGSAGTPFEPQISQFYSYFLSFSSTRSFAHDPAVARLRPGRTDDRQRRRALEKEANRIEESMRLEFNERVRDLTAHIRRRDPRFKAYNVEKAAGRAEAERRRKEAVREQRIKGTTSESFSLPSWCSVPGLDDGNDQRAFGGSGNSSSTASCIKREENADFSDEDSIEMVTEIFCAPCKKAFKNVQQWKNHEQSRKHRNVLISLGIDPDASDEEFLDADDSNELLSKENEELIGSNAGGLASTRLFENCMDKNSKAKELDDSIELDWNKNTMDELHSNFPKDFVENDEGCFRIVVDSADSDELLAELDVKFKDLQIELESVLSADEMKSGSNGGINGSSNGGGGANKELIDNHKARKGRRRTVAKEGSNSSGGETFCCNACSSIFPSRNKLFQHISEEGHYSTVGKGRDASNAKKKKR